VRTIRASAVGVIAAATSTQPSVVLPADAQAMSGTTPEVTSRAPLTSVRPRRLSTAIPKVEGRLAGLEDEANAEDDDRGTGAELLVDDVVLQDGTSESDPRAKAGRGARGSGAAVKAGLAERPR
jgi:hypothetical protein